MGRVLEALRQSAAATRSTESNRPSTAEARAVEEIPYIEVGAHKWMEASAAVLAAPGPVGIKVRDAGPVLAPVAETPAPKVPAIARRAEAGKPEPRRVFLREVVPTGPCVLSPELIAYHSPEHPVSLQYQEIATALAGRPGDRQSHLLLFSAARGEAGTTTVLLNLAVSAALQGRGVVVVDANLRQPGVAVRLGLPEAPGLREVLAGAANLDQVLRSTSVPNLQAIAAGLRPPLAQPRLSTDTTRTVLSRLRERFELTLVDGPCWDGRPDVVLLGSACDAVYLVLPEAEADSPEADALCQLIPEQGGRLAGCILSRF